MTLFEWEDLKNEFFDSDYTEEYGCDILDITISQVSSIAGPDYTDAEFNLVPSESRDSSDGAWIIDTNIPMTNGTVTEVSTYWKIEATANGTSSATSYATIDLIICDFESVETTVAGRILYEFHKNGTDDYRDSDEPYLYKLDHHNFTSNDSYCPTVKYELRMTNDPMPNNGYMPTSTDVF